MNRVDFNGSEDVIRQSRSTLYDAQVSYAPAEYSITKTYTGEYAPGIENSPEKGETATAFAEFENIPDIIDPGVPVKLTVELGFSNRQIINYKGGAVETSAQAFFCEPDAGPNSSNGGHPDFRILSGDSRFISGSENNFATIKKNLSAQIGTGKKGDKIGLCTRQSFGGITVATTYVYEWKKPKARSLRESKSTERYEVPKDENGDYIDSGVRVSDVGGDVQVRHGDDPIGWEYLSPGDVIYAGDVIYTDDDSEVILSLSDMTTFEMGPNSNIWMNTEDEKENKFIRFGGKVLANVKKMVETESMSVEMSQAVAGIKGTIFVAESDDTTSILRVLEGEVELTGKNGGVKLLGAGQAVVVRNGTLGEIEEFSIDEELDSWGQNTSDKVKADIVERSGVGISSAETKNSEKYPEVILIFIGLVVLVIGVPFFKYKKS